MERNINLKNTNKNRKMRKRQKEKLLKYLIDCKNNNFREYILYNK